MNAKLISPKCIYQDQCSGCQLLEIPYEQQKVQKIQNLKDLFEEFALTSKKDISFLSAGEFYLRDRLDFTWHDGRLGLFEKDRHEILDIEVCLQLSPALQNWLTDFRKIKWPLSKASFRLRVGPSGQRGLWIDAANVDIKMLLDQAQILTTLLESSVIVEMGQKRKILKSTEEGLKLRDPEPHIWFQSFMGDKVIPLYSQVASFTQPSLQANKLICDLLTSWVKSISHPKVLEFGSGIGNLSFPVLAAAESLTACEIDSLSLAAFEKTLREQDLQNRVQIDTGDFQKRTRDDFAKFDLLLCNPPRSGLKDFLTPVEKLDAKDRPEFFIYMSCFPESLCVDLSRMKNFYELKEAVIIDQFPQTSHYEVMCLLQRK